MLRSTHSLRLHWIIALCGVVLSPTLLAAQNSGWTNLRQMKPGQQIRIVLNDARSYTGRFQSADDKAIMLRSHGTDRTLGRSEVRRVTVRSGGHRARHVVIGAAIGVGAGVGAGAAIGSSSYVTRSKAIAVAAPALGVLGAAIGAAVPSGGWTTVYSAQ